MLYWHETNRVRPTRMGALLEAVETDFLPIAESYGMRQVGYWQVAPGLGATPETVAVWELDDFGHYVDVVRQRFEGTKGDLAQWFDGVGEWVETSESLLCFPSELTPTVAQIKERNLRAKLCSHERIHVQPARQAEYLRLCEEMWFRRVAEPAGRSIVGLYWSPWKNTRGHLHLGPGGGVGERQSVRQGRGVGGRHGFRNLADARPGDQDGLGRLLPRADVLFDGALRWACPSRTTSCGSFSTTRTREF